MPAPDHNHVLYNPPWHSLNTLHARFAVGTQLAKRYPSDVAIFVAIETPSEAVLHDLEQVVVKGEIVAMQALNPAKDLPGWTVHLRINLLRMVSKQPPSVPESKEEIVTLTGDDVLEMTKLIKLTAPGPFAPRTIELGHYIGIRKDGRLISIAGERFHMPGYREISAVCTHPDYRGKGYARLLVSNLTAEIWLQGDVPFLGVEPDHTSAVRLYETLDFRTLWEFQAYLVSR